MFNEGVLKKSVGGEEYPTNNKRRKSNWTGHILHRNCLLKHVIEVKVEGRLEVTGRRRKQLLDELRIREYTGN